MKLKFINFILASALLVGSAQIFTSCKDNAADINHKLEQKDKALEKLIGENTSKINDLRNDLNAETNSRIADVNALNTRLNETNGKITDLYQQLGNCATKEEFNIVKSQMDQLIAAAGGDINKLVESIKTIEKNKLAIEQIDNILNAEGTGVIARITMLESALSIAQSAIGNLEDSISHHSELLTKVGNDAADALAKAIANEAAINALKLTMEDLATKEQLDFYVDSLGNELTKIAATYATTKWVDENFAKKGDLTNYATKGELSQLATTVSNLSKQIETACENAVIEANKYTDDAIKKLKEEWPHTPGTSGDTWTEDELKTLINDVLNAEGGVNERLSALETDIKKLDEVNTKVRELTTRVEEIADRLNNIVIHQAVSTALGTFNIMGLTNKLLLAYSGHSIQGGDIDFPAVDGYDVTFNAEGLVTGITAKNPVTIEAGQWLMNGTEDGGVYGNFGLVYMSLNPNNVNVDKFDFSLRSSKTGADGLYIPEITPRHTDAELKIGYGRSAENGFYVADVMATESYVNKLQFILSSSFKEKVKNIIDAPRTLASPSTIVSLASALYSEVNGAFPALAVSASWDETKDGKTIPMAVNSEYNLGAIAVNPLSFKLFATLEESGKLDFVNRVHMPDLSSIPDRFNAYFDELTGDIHIKLEANDFTINEVKIQIDLKPIEISIGQVKNPTILIQPEVTDPETGKKFDCKPIEKEIDLSELNTNLETMADEIRGSIQGMIDQLNAQVKLTNDDLKGMTSNIEGQVKELIESMGTQVDTQITDILDGMKSKIDGLLTGALGRYNAISDRMEVIVNKMKTIITHPFYYVQPCLVYKAGNKVGLISANSGVPSVFTVSGSKPAITIIPTTYTLEAAVPCYLKYVGVVDAWENGDDTKATVASVVNNANSAENMNTVLPGDIYTLHEAALQLEKGYTYHIVYQAMDYSGVICGRDYYVTVK